MSSITVSNIHKNYSDLEVLKNINLEIKDGELMTLIGPSGSGKSTLLKIIAGLEDVTKGTVNIGGADVTEVPPQKRDLAMVFQNYALYPQMSVRQNMGFGLKIAGASQADIDKRVEETAKMLEIDAYLERRPRQLSGGQRQRVAMGRAIVRDVQAFLLDEPLSNLDAALRNVMRTEIKSLHARLGRTMIYVTHDQIEAMTLSDRIAIMRDGEIVQLGEPDDLYMRPINTFVASFFGTPKINLMDGEIEEVSNGRMKVRVGPDAVFSLPALESQNSGKLRVGIRPEALHFAPSGVPVEVKLIEPTGSQTEVHISVGGHAAAVLVQGRFRREGKAQAYLNASVDDVHLFDPTTEERIN